MGIRIAWSARSTGGKVKLACPAPRITGATITCSRSRHPAARNRDTVTAPPSIRIRRRPWPARAARIAAGAICPSLAGKVIVSTPGGGVHRVPCATISKRRVPSEANTLASWPSLPLGSMTTRAGCGPDTPHGELRIVGDGGADAYNDTVYQSPQPMQVGKARRAVDVF